MVLLKSIIGQVYSCLVFFRDILDKKTESIVVLAMLLNGLAFVIMCKYYFVPLYSNPDTYIEPEWFENFYIQGVKLVHSSLIFIVITFAKSKGFGVLGRFALVSLFSMWLLNEYYLVADRLPDLYFMYFCLIVYISFLVTALYKLTNRC